MAIRYKRPRFGRYINIGPAEDHDSGIKIAVSSNGRVWNTIVLTKHELRKLGKLIQNYLNNENLQRSL